MCIKNLAIIIAGKPARTGDIRTCNVGFQREQRVDGFKVAGDRNNQGYYSGVLSVVGMIGSVVQRQAGHRPWKHGRVWCELVQEV